MVLPHMHLPKEAFRCERTFITDTLARSQPTGLVMRVEDGPAQVLRGGHVVSHVQVRGPVGAHLLMDRLCPAEWWK